MGGDEYLRRIPRTPIKTLCGSVAFWKRRESRNIWNQGRGFGPFNGAMVEASVCLRLFLLRSAALPDRAPDPPHADTLDSWAFGVAPCHSFAQRHCRALAASPPLPLGLAFVLALLSEEVCLEQRWHPRQPPTLVIFYM